jgi:plastocyanin
VIAAALATLAAMPMAAGGDDASVVAIPGRFYAPQQTSVLVGQPVTWRNDDAVDHTVTSPDAGFDSGRVGHGATYSFTFARPGSYEYHCTIHRYMRGTVHVDTLALHAPAEPTAVGAAARLDGLAPAGTGEVTLERQVPGGGFEPAAATTAGADGRYAFTVAADAPARFRARAGDLLSGEARLDVAPRLALTARRASGRVRARVVVSPAQARGRVVLERYVAERYGWVRVRAATLDARSAASWTLRAASRIQLRARLAGPVGGYAPAVSSPAAAAAAHH